MIPGTDEEDSDKVAQAEADAAEAARQDEEPPAEEPPAEEPQDPEEEDEGPAYVGEAIGLDVHPEGLERPIENLERLRTAESASGKERPAWLSDTRTSRKHLRQAIQVIQRVACPHCGAEGSDIRCERGGDLRYYRCKVCVDPETGAATRFKVKVESPPRST